MTTICKRTTVRNSPNFDYYYYPIHSSQIITVKGDSDLSKLIDYYNKIKGEKKENGRYMIKKQDLSFKSNRGWDLFAHGKAYFCYADAGIAHTYDRKDDSIFYLNNYQKILKLAKLLCKDFGNSYLISIVDRRNSGEETYVVSSQLEKFKNRKIIVK